MWESIVGALLGKVAPSVAEYYIQKQALKHEMELEKLKGKVAWEAAKTKRASESEGRDHDWELLSIQNSGWKDEYVTLLVSIPLVLTFIPHTQPYVLAGFVALETTPVWYQVLTATIIAAAVGVRWWRRKV
jgi:hypothetical protein